jgi:hypothetical protein
MLANPNDKRHGTITGYNNIGSDADVTDVVRPAQKINENESEKNA